MLKIKILTPLHIGSGKEYSIGFNALKDENFIYLFDEFKIVEYFLKKGISIPNRYEELKDLIDSNSKDLIYNKVYFRQIQNNFSFEKDILAHISTNEKVFIPGSSIKGAIRTAYISRFVEEGKFDKEINELEDIENKIFNLGVSDIKERKILEREKVNLIKKINKKIDNLTKEKFKFLKISDSINNNFETQIFKSINIKKEKKHQKYRSEKVEKISNFVECIMPKQEDEVFLCKNDYFNDLAKVCNDFYLPLFKEDFEFYFAKKIDFNEDSISSNQFLLNLGRFGGAEHKSIEYIRALSDTGANVDFETTTRTYALEKNGNPPFFDGELLPFGWILCEIIE